MANIIRRKEANLEAFNYGRKELCEEERRLVRKRGGSTKGRKLGNTHLKGRKDCKTNASKKRRRRVMNRSVQMCE